MKKVHLTDKSYGKDLILGLLLTFLISVPYMVAAAKNGNIQGFIFALTFASVLLAISSLLLIKRLESFRTPVYTLVSSLLWISYFIFMDKENNSIIFLLTYPLFIYAIMDYRKALAINLAMLALFSALEIFYRDLSDQFIINSFNIKVASTYFMIIIISTIWNKYNQKNLEMAESYALFDHLTKVANRRYLDIQIENMISVSERQKRKFAVLYIDIDNFKKVNDSFGHDEGDQILIRIVEHLELCLRSSDFIGRNRGDEFIVLLPEINEEFSPAVVADRILKRETSQKRIPSFSIGIAIFPEDGNTVSALIQKATSAMHHAKKNGKNSFSFFKQGIDEIIRQRFLMANQLQNAIELEELDIVLQPKINGKTKKIYGAEALIRWNNALLGSVSPSDFISIAEDSDIIHGIGTWVYEKVFKILKDIQSLGFKDIILSVNVSPKQITKNTLMSSLITALEKSDISAEFIELEITEGILLNDDDQTADQLHELRKKGFKISIDDFGTGYSSLSYLQKLNIDSIKIDQSFIQNIEKNNTFIITKAIIAIARSLNLQTVAEGVETSEQYRILNELGCDLIQGFYYSKPLKESDFIELLHSDAVNSS